MSNGRGWRLKAEVISKEESLVAHSSEVFRLEGDSYNRLNVYWYIVKMENQSGVPAS
jgi:hypothetical protein